MANATKNKSTLLAWAWILLFVFSLINIFIASLSLESGKSYYVDFIFILGLLSIIMTLCLFISKFIFKLSIYNIFPIIYGLVTGAYVVNIISGVIFIGFSTIFVIYACIILFSKKY